VISTISAELSSTSTAKVAIPPAIRPCHSLCAVLCLILCLHLNMRYVGMWR
jgi:hypothetical protein